MFANDINVLAKDFVIQKSLLFRGSSKTNFIYRVIGGSLEFIKIEDENFFLNLFLCDSQMPQILSEILKKFYLLNESKISKLTEIIAEENFLHYDYRYKQNFYEHKIKRFLTDAAFGLNAATVWKGNYDKHLYAFKNKNGVLEFLPLYELNKIEDYLFFNTEVMIAKDMKSEFGKIYEENGEYFIKLNLQIRFC